ncbi:NAD(P)-dependent oxidoreductase [Pseudomonas sp. MYb118]|uniref:NAD(P)-dependent oxidoreductase n=1 Tax=Pseudomonas sp. MYb118 TaxID=1848720 RepID=UPI0034CF6A0C
MKIGFLGLGTMGQPIAANLLKSGREVRVWNRSAQATQKMVGLGAQAAATAAQAFEADVVFSMFADDAALRSVLLDSGLLAQLNGPRIHINLTTISVASADELARLHRAQGIDYIAAPVMGRADVAADGQLNVLVAGPQRAIDRVQPLFDLIARNTWRLGPQASSANAMKLATLHLQEAVAGLQSERGEL